MRNSRSQTHMPLWLVCWISDGLRIQKNTSPLCSSENRRIDWIAYLQKLWGTSALSVLERKYLDQKLDDYQIEIGGPTA